MTISHIQESDMDTVTVQPGSQTKYYFIPIYGLQLGTNFRDVWCHLKRVVKRLEHIEIRPNSTAGWILVHKYNNFEKVIHTLREPVLVEATKRASLIVPSLMNVHFKTSIQRPANCSDHVSRIINDASRFPDRASSGSSVPVKPKSPPIYTEATDRRYEIVIAHGTYKPPPKPEDSGPKCKARSKPRPAKSGRFKGRKMRRRWSIRSSTSRGSYESWPFVPATPPPCGYEPPYYEAVYPYTTAYIPLYIPNQAPQWYGEAQENYAIWGSKYPVQPQRSWGGWNTEQNAVYGQMTWY
ncbi:hypothetical protein F5B22DRAFT_661837 [Xylaria bambusicola]|uniref:uncharacterized protein n=1 Tax=Xylaria bambusicola TaxID=326684 RepID=UPI002007AD54|nr:uncharacterized protein F5B22DRAFT_661837 [Xylaria bambusicola]KAI0505139.1 hypothetical protein F5B22DRAFT_661837 [Xylaria bambusicola]